MALVENPQARLPFGWKHMNMYVFGRLPESKFPGNCPSCATSDPHVATDKFRNAKAFAPKKKNVLPAKKERVSLHKQKMVPRIKYNCSRGNQVPFLASVS